MKENRSWAFLFSHAVKGACKIAKGAVATIFNTKRYPLTFPVGHFHSPLLDITQIPTNRQHLPFDGYLCWEHVPLRDSEQRAYFENAVRQYGHFRFPLTREAERCYYIDNNFFPEADAFMLASVIRQERPKRIIEVGSGFSSAVMIDTIRDEKLSVSLTLIEPNPERVKALLLDHSYVTYSIIERDVQEVDVEIFDSLESNDILFIDSSHVAKIGSDVSFLFLRVLPRIKAGVIVHVHDIFYPYSYPMAWLKQGRCLNRAARRQSLVFNRDVKTSFYFS